MSQPIKVLLVDDKEDYCKSLSGPARYKNIQIVYNLDWETGFEALKNDPKIEFVILDGKGKIEADQETEKDNFVMRAMKDIDTYSNEKSKNIPYCVNTGFMERFEALEDNVKIFEKNNEDRDQMFEFILSEVEKSEYRTIRMQFDEPFKPFDIGIIDNVHEHLLVDILKAYNYKDYRKINLNLQRDLFEAIFKSLNNPIPCIPNSFFDETRNNKPNQEWCTIFFEGRPTRDNLRTEHRINKVIPKDIYTTIRRLKESVNQYSHLSDEVILKAQFLSNTFLLLELLEWIPKFVDEHYKNFI